METKNLKLNDDNWHKVHLTRADRLLTISIDDVTRELTAFLIASNCKEQ